MGRGWGGNEKGEVSLRATWDQGEQDRITQEEGFQVSKRDSGTREVRQAKEELSRGIIRGIRQGVCAMCSHILSILYISCYYVYVANKRIVFRL